MKINFSVMKSLLIFILICPIQIFGQNITGTITDSKTKQPVEYATVYINGTTIGTISNTKGNFTIEKVPLPCEVVVSHISYTPVIFPIDENSNLSFNISLEPKLIEIGQISVKEQNLRKEKIEHFKKEFFGIDVWGRNAKLENEDDLIFKTEYFHESAPDSNLIGKIKTFSVESAAPLKISLPLLGYDLQFDLMKFIIRYNLEFNEYDIKILGHYFFKPFEKGAKRKAKKYTRNRIDAYYNSPQHFSHSLYKKELIKNGYVVFEYIDNKEVEGARIKKEFKLDSCLVYNGEEAIVKGLKDRSFYLNYYGNFRGFPLSLKKRHNRDPEKSKIYFIYDKCVIRKNGTRPGESITFGGSIGIKRVGASLPYDFVLEF